MSDKELKETIDIVASIEVHNETEAIAKEELMSYAEELQIEHNVLIEFEKWLEEQNPTNSNENFVGIRLADIKNKLQELKGDNK